MPSNWCVCVKFHQQNVLSANNLGVGFSQIYAFYLAISSYKLFLQHVIEPRV